MITCPDCGNEYDDALAACGVCGCPNPALSVNADADAGAAEAPEAVPRTITCPDCGNEYDDALAACGVCGRPNPALSVDAAADAGAGDAASDGGFSAGAASAPNGGYSAGTGGAGYGAPGAGAPGEIPNYLVQAILLTLCCCLPTGIVAIVKSTQVNTLRDAGNLAGAWQASKAAKKWCWISLGVGIVAHLIFWLVGGTAFVALMSAAAEAGYQ